MIQKKYKKCLNCEVIFNKKSIDLYGKQFEIRLFCSQKCMGIHRIGIKNPNWKNGTGALKLKNGFIRKQLNWICQNCGSLKFLETHHLDKNRNNNKISNLKVLCRSCHTIIHDKIRTIREWRKNAKR